MDENELGYLSEDGEDILKIQFPLHRACRDGDLEALSTLLSSGNCDFYEEDYSNGWTPIHWAAYSGKLECVRKLSSLMSHGLDKASTRSGQTPFHLSAFTGHPHCLQWLLQSGACIDCQDYLGETPIHKSARSGSMECISLLVSQGAKLSLRNHNGSTPSQVAIECGFQECANYLERAMQIQQQATGVYDEMRTPVTQPSNNTQSLSDIKTSAPPIEIVDSQGLNGGLMLEAGSHEGANSDITDCDMEMDDPSSYRIVNGIIDTGNHCDNKINGLNIFSNGHTNGLSHIFANGHMNGEDQKELFYMSGGRRKRGCDDLEDGLIKRCRVGASDSNFSEADAYNNNIVSSYHAILSISTNPVIHAAESSLQTSASSVSLFV